MRPTTSVYSGMPTGKTYMGWWGDMGGPKQKGINQYVVSPVRQKPMAGVFRHWITRGTARLAEQSIYFVIPLALGYGIITWAAKDNHLRNSKEGQKQGKFP